VQQQLTVGAAELPTYFKEHHDRQRLMPAHTHIQVLLQKGTKLRQKQSTYKGGGGGGCRATGRPQTSQNINLKNADFVATMKSTVLRYLPFSRNQPLNRLMNSILEFKNYINNIAYLRHYFYNNFQLNIKYV